MTDTNNIRPSVPSSSGVATYGSGGNDEGTEGAKNHWVQTGCYWNLQIGTYNARTLSSDADIIDIEAELNKIKFDIIGLCETRRKGEGCMTLNHSGHNLYYKGGDTHHRGVGFIVHKDIVGNIQSFNGVSDRVAQINIKINKKYHLNIIVAYMPTTNHSDEECEEVYETIDQLYKNSKTHYNIIMGDFNAKVGKAKQGETCMGKFDYGSRNNRGDTLVNFSERHGLKIMNTFFEKKANRRWTWISPNKTTKNEIDFILTDKPRSVTDVSVLNKFNTGSDHRLVRATFTINTRIERQRLTRQTKRPNHLKLSEKASQFQIELSNRFEALNNNEDLSTNCDNITNTILDAAINTVGRQKPRKPNKLSDETKRLREKRRYMKRSGSSGENIEYTIVCKEIRRRMAEEINAYNEEEQMKALENNKNFRKTRQTQCIGRSNITAMKEEDGTLIQDLNRIIKRCEEFYTRLYSTRRPQDQPFANNNTQTKSIPRILLSEVESAIKRLKRDKAPGEDNISAGMLQDGGEPVIKELTCLYNRCLTEGKVPNKWKNGIVTILHKKGDKADIKNYRPISLLSIIYKTFSQILLKRMSHTLDYHQPREQAGFRSGYSTIDHIQTISQLQEKAKEYSIPLCFAFVDYEKAFDSIEYTPMFKALENQGVDEGYINIIRDLYKGATSTLKLHKDSDDIKLERGARQGDNISPKLFTACLQDTILNQINWDNRGINIDGEYLAHLEFADDILLIAHSPQELEQMLIDIHNASKPVGLNMHLGKTKVMFNKHVTPAVVTVNGTIVEQVDSYVYLGRTISHDGSLLPEIKRRITLGWAALRKFDNIIKSKKTSKRIKTKIHNEFILPVMTYGSETWALNNNMETLLAVAQRKIERIMLNITLKDRKPNTWIRQQTGIKDIIQTIKESKHRWAGHVARISDNRWTIRVTEWTPRSWKRPKGRPGKRWRDDLTQCLGPTWRTTAKDRTCWKASREGFLLHE